MPDQLLWCNGEHVGFSPRRSRFDSGQECHFQNAPVRYVVGDQAFNLANRVQIPAGAPFSLIHTNEGDGGVV